MRRRKFVKATSGLAVGGLAGCASGDNDNSDDDTENTPDTVRDEQDATDSEDGPPQDASGPADTLEAYHKADTGGFARTTTLSHSLWGDDPYELVSIETETLERDLQVKRIAQNSSFAQDTLSAALDGEDTALVASTIRINDDGESRTSQREYFLATEDGNWRVLSKIPDIHGSEVQPNSDFEFEYDNEDYKNALIINLTDGESVAATDVYLRGSIDGKRFDHNFTSDGVFSQLAGLYSVSGVGGFDGDKRIYAGQGIEIAANDYPLDSFDIYLVWDTGEDSATLAEASSD